MSSQGGGDQGPYQLSSAAARSDWLQESVRFLFSLREGS